MSPEKRPAFEKVWLGGGVDSPCCERGAVAMTGVTTRLGSKRLRPPSDGAGAAGGGGDKGEKGSTGWGVVSAGMPKPSPLDILG